MSASSMVFAPDGRLIVADWRRDMFAVYDIPSVASAEAPFHIMDLAALSSLAAGPGLRATALAFRASDGLAVVALAGDEGAVELIGVAADGKKVPLPSEPVETLNLNSQVGEGSLWKERPVRSLTITDLQFHGGALYASGIANADFSSVFRRYDYPFSGKSADLEVEMYHAVHNQWETRAPIRAFNFVSLKGEPFVVAAYTCTPLVTFPLSALEGGGRVKGKTIAELGFGNTPLSVVPFQLEHEGAKSDWVVVANSAKSGDLISLGALETANAGPGLTKPVKPPFQGSEGLSALPLPLANLIKFIDQGPQFFLALRRQPETGKLELVSYRKGAFFRLSDFVNEYDFPNYDYPKDDGFQQSYVRPFHQMMRTEEGFPELAK